LPKKNICNVDLMSLNFSKKHKPTTRASYYHLMEYAHGVVIWREKSIVWDPERWDENTF